MANKKLTPLEILYREFKNAKTDAARNEAWRNFEIKRGEMYPPRSDRKSAMLRDSAAVAAKYPTKVLGGENHRYYEPGRRIRMDVDETAKRSPEVFIDPESGERYVRAFHYTNPENIDAILQNGLAARIGPDAKNFQKRAGVWTSFGNANPMPYDYVNRASIGEKGYAMEPLEIRIPEEEWKAMPMDHTGETVNDQVMVFRPSKAKPYGTVDVAGEKAPVVIPPEYISRYEFPKDWETDVAGGKSLWGYTPTKKATRKNDNSFFRALPDDVKDDAYKALGKDASNNAVNQWAVENRQQDVKNALMCADWNRNFSYVVPSTKLDGSSKRFDKEADLAASLESRANAQWFGNTDFTTAYDAAIASENTPAQKMGHFQKGYGTTDPFGYGFEAPRTKKLVTDIVGDNTPIWELVNYPGRFGRSSKLLEKAKTYGIEIPTNANDPIARDYLNYAGRRVFDGLPSPNNMNGIRRDFNGYKDLNGGVRYTRDDLRKANVAWKNDFYWKGGYKEKVDNLLSSGNAEDAKKAKEIIEQYRMDLMSPSVRKRRQQYVLGLNKVPYSYNVYEAHRQEPADVAKAKALSRAMRSDELNDALSQETDLYLKQHPELDFDKDFDKAFFEVKKNVGEPYAQAIADAFYPEELQKVRQQLVEDWKKQFTKDSLNRVFGHEIGRKVGKYRASRGKPVNPKQL